MSSLREFEVKLIDWETRLILDSISKEMARLKEVNATSEDEDIAADAGNDYIELSGLFERLSENAINVFGNQILNFSSDNL